MRGCVLALHRVSVNVSVVWMLTLCRRALRSVSTACCALCCYGVVLCCIVPVRSVPPPASAAVCPSSRGRCVFGGLPSLCAHRAAASACSRADAVADLERVFPCAP